VSESWDLGSQRRNKIDVTRVALGNTLAVQVALHKKSKESAEGAQCESQGQARAKRSASPLGCDKAREVKA